MVLGVAGCIERIVVDGITICVVIDDDGGEEDYNG